MKTCGFLNLFEGEEIEIDANKLKQKTFLGLFDLPNSLQILGQPKYFEKYFEDCGLGLYIDSKVAQTPDIQSYTSPSSSASNSSSSSTNSATFPLSEDEQNANDAIVVQQITESIQFHNIDICDDDFLEKCDSEDLKAKNLKNGDLIGKDDNIGLCCIIESLDGQTNSGHCTFEENDDVPDPYCIYVTADLQAKV
tara:strand:- start:1508 stop:2092 length:585 start_codon:yes stop_codon:yes gene_type:complete